MLKHNIIPLFLVAGCGVLTAIATLQPELKKQNEAQSADGLPLAQRSTQSDARPSDNAISSAIAQDIQAAKKELLDTNRQGFAWGIRQALFGKKEAGLNSAEEENARPK